MEKEQNSTMTEEAQSSQSSNTQTKSEFAEQNLFANAMLFRHPTDKLIGGVCGGLADYVRWDPVLVRIIWLVATIMTGGGGLLAYFVLWALLPVGTTVSGQVQPAAIELNERNLSRAAVVMITLGGLWLLSNVGILPWMWNVLWFVLGTFFWPALLIGIGYLLLRNTGAVNWRFDLNNVQEQFRSRVNQVKVPGKENLSSKLKDVWMQVPLKRSRTDRLLMGLCGGISHSTGLDANLVRLVWAAFSIGSIGMGVLLYVGLSLLLPEEAPANVTNYAEHSQDVQIIEGAATRVL